jgi:hypothetical protein
MITVWVALAATIIGATITGFATYDAGTEPPRPNKRYNVHRPKNNGPLSSVNEGRTLTNNSWTRLEMFRISDKKCTKSARTTRRKADATATGKIWMKHCRTSQIPKVVS